MTHVDMLMHLLAWPSWDRVVRLHEAYKVEMLDNWSIRYRNRH